MILTSARISQPFVGLHVWRRPSWHRPAHHQNIVAARQFSVSDPARSIADPQVPGESFLYKVKRPGRLFKEPMDPNTYLSSQPLYTGPYSRQIAFSKRWSLGLSIFGAYLGFTGLDTFGLSSGMALLGCVPFVLPIPLLQWYTGNYVTRIFRIYRRDEPQTYENLTRNETLMVEKLSLFGRSSYGTPVKVRRILLDTKRNGWINWVHIGERGNITYMYVADNIGGIKMDRIWGLVEKNSGVDNGRLFLDQAPGLVNTDYSKSKPETVKIR